MLRIPDEPLAKKVTSRKRRTRAHVIADLSRNHVERFALLAGYSTTPPSGDYGLDLNIYTFSDDGEVENGYVSVQLKSSDNPNYSADRQRVRVPLDRRDLASWLQEPWPVILVLYDAHLDKAYWLYVQRHFEQIEGFDPSAVGQTFAVQLPVANEVSVEALREFRNFKERVLAQAQSVIRHV